MAQFEKYLTEFLDGEMEKFHMPGYDCSVYHHHKEIYRHQNGVMDFESKRPLTKDTMYHVYSNTKVISCTAALQLFERGKFLLEDRIDRFFPEFSKMKVETKDGIRDAENPITIRDLFCMTAGIGDGSMPPELGMRVMQETGGVCRPIEMPKYLAQIPLRFEPGTGYYYGICHEVLAALIEKISDMSFSEYLQDNIFTPLGMEHTGFSMEKLGSENIASQYSYNGPDEELTPKGNHNCLIPPLLKESASGGLITTVDDYMKFQEALCKGNIILRKPTIDLMRMNQLKGDQWKGYGYTDVGLGYGLGVRTIVNQAKAGSTVGFGPFGWGGAAGSYGSIDPENELTIFYVQTVFGTGAGRTQNLLRNLVYAFIE